MPEITAAALKAFFANFTWHVAGVEVAGFTCDKMQRAWRNRSPVTSARWWNAAQELTGNSDHAGTIYAACGHFVGDTGIFDAGLLTDEDLEKLSKIIAGYVRKPPEKALSVCQFEDRKRHTPTREQVSHALYDALVALRTHRGPEAHAEAVTSAKAAEREYRRLYRPKENHAH